MKMQNLLAQHPIKATVGSLGGLGVSTIEALTVYVQFGIAVFSLILVGLTIFLKVREIIRGSLK
jgi:hypothetical protein